MPAFVNTGGVGFACVVGWLRLLHAPVPDTVSTRLVVFRRVRDALLDEKSLQRCVLFMTEYADMSVVGVGAQLRAPPFCGIMAGFTCAQDARAIGDVLNHFMD